MMIAIVSGIMTDLFLRINTGEEGNLFIHSVVLVGTALLIYGFLNLFGKHQ